MRVGNDDIRVDIFGGGRLIPKFSPGAKVRVSGIYRNAVTEDGPGSARAFYRWRAGIRSTIFPHRASIRRRKPPTKTNRPSAANRLFHRHRPVLRTAADVKAYARSRNEGTPVSIRGVVTATLPAARSVVVQDSTRGIYVSLQDVNDRIVAAGRILPDGWSHRPRSVRADDYGGPNHLSGSRTIAATDARELESVDERKAGHRIRGSGWVRDRRGGPTRRSCLLKAGISLWR